MINIEKIPLGGIGYAEVWFGPWRQKGDSEIVDPQYVQKRDGNSYVPVRIYGPKPPEVPINQKILPMPLPTHTRYQNNNHLPTT